MFIYKIPTVDKLLQICKNREYVQNNPDLCKLLEDPMLKDDTELAIRYNEYKQGKPDSAKEFVEYYFTHGPELDTNTLIEWRDRILSDPELYEYADTQIDIVKVQDNKKKNKDYSWVGDLIDCLNNPCQYLKPISTSMACLGDSTAKYNLKNTAGNDSVHTLVDLPEEIIHKMPLPIIKGVSQLTSMISDQMGCINAMISKNGKASKEDPYIIQRSELIGSDVMADIASRFGDCFRIAEFLKRYNPYNRGMNMTTADINGTVIYTKSGKAKQVSPRGNIIKSSDRSAVFSDNRASHVLESPEKIATYHIQDVNAAGFLAFGITAYGAMLTADNVYYSDGTEDAGTNAGYVSNSNYRVLPNSYGARTKADLGKLANGAATTTSAIKDYFDSLIKTKFPNYDIPNNYVKLLNTARKQGDVTVLIKFPASSQVISLPIFDCNGNGIGKGLTIDGVTGKGGAPSSYKMPWVDITAQFFVTSEGLNCASLYSAATGEKINKSVSGPVTMERLESASNGKRIKSCLNITGGSQTALARFILSESFCSTNGLDTNIFSNTDGTFSTELSQDDKDLQKAMKNTLEDPVNVEEAVDVASSGVDMSTIGGYAG